MIICSQCGVALEEKMTVCPLCNTPVNQQPVTDSTGKEHEAEPDEKFMADFVKLTKIQKRKLFWELSGIILFSGILVTLITDLVITGNITWSRYSITICLVLFINTTLLSFWRNRLLVFLGGSFISTSVLLVLLDVYNEKAGWGTQLGIPLLLALYLIIFILVLFNRATRQHGFNMLGYIFLAIGLYALCIEGFVDRYVQGEIAFRWSLIVLVSMIPIAIILFFFHYRLNKGIELRRFFHI